MICDLTVAQPHRERVNRLVCGLKLHDFGTTFKAYRRDAIKDLQLYGELHRFIPALASWSGASVAEIPISNPTRVSGKSHYGPSRTINRCPGSDLHQFISRLLHKALEVFRQVGPGDVAATGRRGALVLAFEKFIRGVEIMKEHGPLIMATVFLIICGIQLISLGLARCCLARITSLKTSASMRWPRLDDSRA